MPESIEIPQLPRDGHARRTPEEIVPTELHVLLESLEVLRLSGFVIFGSNTLRALASGTRTVSQPKTIHTLPWNFDISVRFPRECEDSFRLRSPAGEERQQGRFGSTLTSQGGSSKNNGENDWTYGP